MRVIHAALVLCVLCECLPLPARSQSLPGTVDDTWLLQREREAQLRREQESVPDVRLQPTPSPPAPLLPAVESPCFTICRLHIDGDDAEKFSWLSTAADRSTDGQRDTALGRCLGSDGIHIVLQRLQQALLKRGYVTTRLLAAPQDLSSGVLAVTVVPGRVRSVRFADGTLNRANAWNAMTLQQGDLLELPALEQSLENFKRVPTADADMEIVPSADPDARPGDSDIVLHWSQARPFRINLSLDDAGVRSTGRLQSTFTFAVDHGLTLNDLFYISVGDTVGERAPGTHDSQSRTLHYSLPWRDWLLSVTHSDWSYRQSVPTTTAENLYSGTSHNTELAATRLLYRDSQRKITGSLKLWSRESDSHLNDAELEQQRRHTAGWEAQLSHREQVSDGTLDASLAYRRGTGAFSSKEAPEEPTGDGSARMRIVRADLLLSLPFTAASQSWRYSAGMRIQWNGTPLTPQDRFAIGNRYTVRGFDGESLLTGDRGWLLRQEIGWSVGALGSELYAGIDTGHVGGRSAALLPGRELTGAVIGLRGGMNGFAWDGFIGRPLSRPEGFRTADTTAGFYLSASF